MDGGMDTVLVIYSYLCENGLIPKWLMQFCDLPWLKAGSLHVNHIFSDI